MLLRPVKKHTALLAQNLVKTAKEFIFRAAAESSTSGQAVRRLAS